MISYYELLGKIKEGTQPEFIKYIGDVYKWDGRTYYTNTGFIWENLEDNLKGKRIDILLKDPIIEILDSIALTEEEKENLKKVLEPYKDNISYIYITEAIIDRTKSIKVQMILTNDMVGVGELKLFYNEDNFKNIHLDFKYTPEELGLWETEMIEKKMEDQMERKSKHNFSEDVEISDKIADMFNYYAEEVQHIEQEELSEVLILIHNIRQDLENGIYNTENKKWSELNWRIKRNINL